VIQEFQRHGILNIYFVDPIAAMIEGAQKSRNRKNELYTEEFAHQYSLGNKKGIDPYIKA
jgi:pyridoxine 5-phosphate synthase